jgi:hypothetical protein
MPSPSSTSFGGTCTFTIIRSGCAVGSTTISTRYFSIGVSSRTSVSDQPV